MPLFRKEERLCSKKLIEQLFTQNNAINSYPLRINFLLVEPVLNVPAQVLFVVSKKRFKKAHDRNRVKRVLRECYRLQKHILYDFLTSKNISLVLSVSYNDPELPNSNLVAQKLEIGLKKLTNAIEPKIKNDKDL